jgi:23S rRNA A1618 N6-methylase RlmF
LKKIRQYHNDTNTVLDFSRTVIDQELTVIDGKSNVGADEVGVAPFTWTKKATKQAKTSTAEHRNLQKQRKLARDLQKAKKVEDQERLDSFQRKMCTEEFGGKAEAIEEASEGIRRKVGEKAVNSKSYKDRNFRRGLYQLSSSARTFQDILPYVSEVAN